MPVQDKIILAALNSRFIQSNTAVYYLYEILRTEGYDCDVASHSVNEDFHVILYSLISQNPSVICFSCYIWNIELVIKLCSSIRKIRRNIKIVLGGPEVSYDSTDAAYTHSADIIVKGEGENIIIDAVEAAVSGVNLDQIFHITEALDDIPSPYTPYMMEKEKDKLIYFESSRGCPFNCIYCLSSTTKGVRYFSLERVREDIESILEYKPDVIKFTDRSFNCDTNRAVRLLEYIKSLNTETCFHLEIYPGLMEKEMIEILISMPPGRVQIEAGIQSTDKKVLMSSGRPQDSKKALENLRQLIDVGNIHVHTDLIAGLPDQDYKAFRKSFNETLRLIPHVLQVGFIKLLKGTEVRDIDGYEYLDTPPYEVLSSNSMSYMEIEQIRGIAEMVDLFFNNAMFRRFMEYEISKGTEPYQLFSEIYNKIDEEGYKNKGISRNNKYRILMEEYPDGKEYLAFDYLSSLKTGRIPEFLGKRILKGQKAFEILGMEGKKLRDCTVAQFNFTGAFETFVFDYTKRDAVSKLFKSIKVKHDMKG
jgi:radical SAM superfamily enzyme YgiQ (UPF0313 family)